MTDTVTKEAPATYADLYQGSQLPAIAQHDRVPETPSGSAPTPRPEAIEVQQRVRTYPAAMVRALLNVQRKIKPVGKLGHNDFQNYDYQKWEDVLVHLGPLLAEEGLFIQQSQIGSSVTRNDDLIQITFEFEIIFEETGEVWPKGIAWQGIARLRDQKGIYDDKAATKCATQAHKYFCLHTFKIRTRDMVASDSDGNATRAPKIPSAPAQAATSPYNPPYAADGTMLPHQLPRQPGSPGFSGWMGVVSWMTRASSSSNTDHGSLKVKRSPWLPWASNTRVSPPLI